MKHITYLIIILFILVACQSQVDVTETIPTNTVTAEITLTSTSQPTIPPQATQTQVFNQIVPVPNLSNEFTLTEFNAGTEMKLLNTIGTGTAYDIKFSPDGKFFGIATGRGIFFYDGTSFKQLNFIEMDSPVSAIAFSPDGEILALAMQGKTSLINVNSGQKIIDLDSELLVAVYKLAYGVGGHVAAIGDTCSSCGTPTVGLILWDATGKQIYSQKDIWTSTIALEFTSDGSQLLFGGRGINTNGISIIDTKTGKEISSFNDKNTGVSSGVDAPFIFIFNDDGSRLFVSSVESSNVIFDLNTQTHIPFPLCEVYMTGNGKIGACSKEQKILIFDLQNGNELESIDIDIEASSLYDRFTLSPNSQFLVYYGKTGINVIDLSTKEKFTEIELTDLGISESGIIEIDGVERYVVATLTYSGEVKIYDLQTGELIRKLKSDCCKIKGFNFAPDRKTFATVEENLLEFWDLQTGNSIYKIKLEMDYSGPIAFSPDGSHIFLTELKEDHITELDLQSGSITKPGDNAYPYGYADPFAVNNYNFNHLGNFIKLGFQNRNQPSNPYFEDVKTGEKIVLPVEIFDIEAFSFSSDGQYLVYGNLEGIFVWNIKELKIQSILNGHDWRGADGWSGKIRSLSFNPQSNLLVSVGWDGTIRLWNARFGTELRRLNVCCSADFTPDGRYLITHGNGVAHVWGIP